MDPARGVGGFEDDATLLSPMSLELNMLETEPSLLLNRRSLERCRVDVFFVSAAYCFATTSSSMMAGCLCGCSARLHSASFNPF